MLAEQDTLLEPAEQGASEVLAEQRTMVEPGEMDTTTVEPAEQGAMVGQTEMEEEPESTMSVSLKELCQMVNVPYDQARALIESDSSDGESVEREEATMEDTVMEDTVMEDTVVHAGRVNF
ncbi:hypothetical protein ROHU_003121 [Labeo rohita]|uniref:Uncharacterized protein n=1 Tax=Labeo rohita TaxID=84645 RepID=A0A498NXV1_LABRO|nr:hypothetical protein ROHU_003121 [Labeo rohita]